MPNSPFVDLLILEAAVAIELVLAIEWVVFELLERNHIPQDVILSANLAGRAEEETIGILGAGQVAYLSK